MICAAMMISTAPTHAGFMSDLLDAVCTEETLGGPWRTIGLDGEVGDCQILPRSARVFGKYRGPLIDLLDDRDLNRRVALAILWDCRRRLRTDDYQRVAFCYNAGPGAEYTPNNRRAWYYAKRVTMRLSRATMPTTRLRLASYERRTE